MQWPISEGSRTKPRAKKSGHDASDAPRQLVTERWVRRDGARVDYPALQSRQAQCWYASIQFREPHPRPHVYLRARGCREVTLRLCWEMIGTTRCTLRDGSHNGESCNGRPSTSPSK